MLYEIKYDDSQNHLECKFEAAKSIVKNKIKNEISNSMGLICPDYNTIKSKITRNRRKQLSPDIIIFDEIPTYFRDSTFYNESIFSYQIFITRTYVKELNCFYTTSISILKIKNKYNSIEITLKIFHCDFEKVISNATEKVFHNEYSILKEH
ncbi:hypothetical protein H8356DRAFT_1333455 [Neocallimastix lanati (nom. inval.)]|nr:hypothetical protein H8356DRAFT_1333455 [Neocallimastix sp. JGI-2020a]